MTAPDKHLPCQYHHWWWQNSSLYYFADDWAIAVECKDGGLVDWVIKVVISCFEMLFIVEGR